VCDAPSELRGAIGDRTWQKCPVAGPLRPLSVIPEPSAVLHLIVAARGALNSLMTEVIEDQIQVHVVDPAKDAERARGAEELIEAVRAYLK
jgi:Metal-sensitive transcriptional repressor